MDNIYLYGGNLTLTLEGVSISRRTGGKNAYFFVVEYQGDSLMLDYQGLQAVAALFKGLDVSKFIGIEKEL